MRNGFRFAFFICTCVIRTLLCTLQTMQGLMPSTARTCLPAQSCDNPTNGGRGEQRSPAFIRLHGLYKFNLPQLLETGRRVSAKQKLRYSPTGIRASFCRRKIAPLGAGFYFILEYNFGQLCSFLIPHS